MESIVFIADDWGTSQGGINSFNYDFVKAVGNLGNNRFSIVCVVPEATADEVNEAADSGVNLIGIGEGFSSANIIDRILNSDFKNVFCWVGHDTITGRHALDCAKLCSKFVKLSYSAIIHHMDYIRYYTSKSGNASETYLKHQQQVDIISASDFIFAIGPNLREAAENKLKEKKVDKKVFELIPGLADIKKSNIKSPFCGITFGRLGDKDEIVKQGKLAIVAFSRMCAHYELNDSILTVVGLDEDTRIQKNKELQEVASEHAGTLITINGLPYLKRNDIYHLLEAQSVSMMLSTHEGFGLSGWESIAAEVPLILSKDTGLYRFIDEKLAGAGIGCVHEVKITTDFEKDVKTVSDELIKIKNNYTRADNNAKLLKSQLKEYTWEKTAKDFICHITENLNHVSETLVMEEQKKGEISITKLENTESNNDNLVILGEQLKLLTQKYPILYHTTTYFAYKLNKHCYNNLHYVWCSPQFDSEDINPDSANPLKIFKNLYDGFQKREADAHILKHKTGLIKGVSEKHKKGIIAEDEMNHIIQAIHNAKPSLFRPVVYVIPTAKIESVIKSISRSVKSGIFSQEFLIEELPTDAFDLIDIK